jgi:hypothetical protein
MPQTTVKGDKAIILGDSGGVAKEVAEALDLHFNEVLVFYLALRATDSRGL